MLSENINSVLVLSLPFDVRRKEHIINHFRTQGITRYEFVDAISHYSPLVKEMYLSGRVKAYPSCFRCGLASCNCENNTIIQQQVANWLSFKKVWEQVASAEGPVLVCEDDVLFYPGAIRLLNQWLENTSSANKFPELVRLAHSGLQTDVSLLSHECLTQTDNEVMSNAAYILTPSLAKKMLALFDKIETTSDIWVHHFLPKLTQSMAVTLEPLIATELSFNKKYAKFPSNIHPKGIDERDEKRRLLHKKRFESEQSYKLWLANITA